MTKDRGLITLLDVFGTAIDYVTIPKLLPLGHAIITPTRSTASACLDPTVFTQTARLPILHLVSVLVSYVQRIQVYIATHQRSFVILDHGV